MLVVKTHDVRLLCLTTSSVGVWRKIAEASLGSISYPFLIIRGRPITVSIDMFGDCFHLEGYQVSNREAFGYSEDQRIEGGISCSATSCGGCLWAQVDLIVGGRAYHVRSTTATPRLRLYAFDWWSPWHTSAIVIARQIGSL